MAQAGEDEDHDLLRTVVERLAVIPRLPTSPGERRAAVEVARFLTGFGCSATVQKVPAFAGYPRPIGALSALGALSAVAALTGRRKLGAAGGLLAAAGIVDDITSGANHARKLLGRPRTAYNVVAEAGDPAADRVLCVLAHHDAAPSGVIFDQRVHEWLVRKRPDLVERLDNNPPLWWLVFGAPLAVAAGSAAGKPPLVRAGLAGCLLSLAAMIDVGSRPAVPGANDNLSGVAALIALARRLCDRPPAGLRVLLVSAGAEEALQEGIRGFARRAFPQLPADRTWFVNLDTIGSPHLVLLEGEGPVRMHDYDPAFKQLVDDCAAGLGVGLRRGLRARTSTDGCVPARAGYRTATLVSVDDNKLMPHYHLDTDRPEHLHYDSIVDAVRLVEAVAHRLAGDH